MESPALCSQMSARAPSASSLTPNSTTPSLERCYMVTTTGPSMWTKAKSSRWPLGMGLMSALHWLSCWPKIWARGGSHGIEVWCTVSISLDSQAPMHKVSEVSKVYSLKFLSTDQGLVYPILPFSNSPHILISILNHPITIVNGIFSVINLSIY